MDIINVFIWDQLQFVAKFVLFYLTITSSCCYSTYEVKYKVPLKYNEETETNTLFF